MITKAQERAKSRMLSVEVLRVCALLGIAIFHTFQNWYGAVVSGEAMSWVVAETLYQPSSLAVMGCMDQLGAWGNHVFFMISGYFLLPRVMRDAIAGESVEEEGNKTFRRVVNILSTVAFYVVFAWVVALLAPQAELVSMTGVGWLAQGLQFVWLYVLFVLLCPVLGRLMARCQRHMVWVLAVTTFVVYAANLYIAFFAPGDEYRTLWEWRKMMSGVTYGLSFVMGGCIGARSSLAAREPRANSPMVVLILAILVTILAETYAAVRCDLSLLTALSYKSTSPFACAMAVAALNYAVSLPSDAGSRHLGLARACAYMTSGMLGFYVMQALFSWGWHRCVSELIGYAIDSGFWTFVLSGVLLSALLFLALVSVDVLVRQPMMAWINKLLHSHR